MRTPRPLPGARCLIVFQVRGATGFDPVGFRYTRQNSVGIRSDAKDAVTNISAIAAMWALGDNIFVRKHFFAAAALHHLAIAGQTYII